MSNNNKINDLIRTYNKDFNYKQKVPSFFSFEKRSNHINKVNRSNLNLTININKENLNLKLKKKEINKLLYKKSNLNFIQIIILKIINFVVKLFKNNFIKIDQLLSSNNTSKFISKKCIQILSSEIKELTPVINHISPFNEFIESEIYEIQKIQLENLLDDLEKNKSIDSYKNLQLFNKNKINQLCKLNKKKINDVLSNSIQLEALITSLEGLYSDQIKTYSELIQETKSNLTSPSNPTSNISKKSLLKKEKLLKSIRTNDSLFKNLSKNKKKSSRSTIYSVSSERLTKSIPSSILSKPINVTMVSAEYSGLMKAGGLAEAVEALSKGIKQQNPENQVNLIFPKYSHLPKNILETFQELEPQSYTIGEDEYSVYIIEIEGVKCHFIDHKNFTLQEDKPNIYGPNHHKQSKRFAKFSELAADFIYKRKNTDVIHLHDWHVSGVALKLKNDHPEEWKNGTIPPVLFTFHNNNRHAQGRLNMGPYSYDSVIEGFKSAGIIKTNGNLFLETLSSADAVTTVSESFGQESQQIKHGEGISFAVKQAAKVGKLTGILNGANPSRWNPSTDHSLLNWEDIETGENIDLSYNVDHHNILSQKKKIKQQLQKWITEEFPKKKIDCSKPIVTYVGRFDSYQKGLDKLEEAIQATIKNGGQFILMGIAEDKKATKILDRLEKKYKNGVLFIRDYKEENGRLHFQQGNDERPGIGSIIRAASDFIFIPSKFEPCGLVQFEGWLFGSLAIGSKVGGLADSIIPHNNSNDSSNNNDNNFNGFLFNRDGSSKTQAKTVIKQALNFWSKQTDEQKNDIFKRLIKEGRESGWNSKKMGFSQSEKYRFAYENAIRRVKLRKTSDKEFNKIEALKNRILLKKEQVNKNAYKEETYLKNYYFKNLNSKELDRLYRKLPTNIRVQVPSPYGIQVNNEKYKQYGAFLNSLGTDFSVFAPKAKTVSVVLLNDDGKPKATHLMKQNSNGDWKLTVPSITEGQKYYYKINDQLKIDPYGRSFGRVKNSKNTPYSVVVNSTHQWEDNSWMEKKAKNAGKSIPMSIYELSPTNWMKEDGQPLNYRNLAEKLVTHCQDLGYTHVELMGILEHPNEHSWGYQVTGYFSPNSRMGSVDDFKFMIDHLHKNNIGAILDWVPAHFAKDDFSLSQFDGSNLYEANGLKHSLSIRNQFFKFGSKHFDYQKKEVREFLISSASYWLKEMHIDGLRVDCVRSLLSSENQKSSALFMRDLNAIVHNKHPGSFTIAEEFSGDRNTTAPSYKNGLDFDMKWHVNWMNDVLSFFSSPLKNRKTNYNKIINAIMGDNHHKQVMFFSHDQLQNSIKTLINKTPNIKNSDKKYANVRAMLSFMMCLPGKKLHFMGSEFGNQNAWDNFIGKEIGVLDQVGLKENKGRHLADMIKQLNHIYTTEKAFYKYDSNGHDLEWIEDPKKEVHAYRRVDLKGDTFACFHNFSDKETKEFTITIQKDSLENPETDLPNFEEIFNSDAIEFGGKDRNNKQIAIENNDLEIKYTIQIPPLSTVIIKEQVNRRLKTILKKINKTKNDNLNTIFKNIKKELINMSPLTTNKGSANALTAAIPAESDPIDSEAVAVESFADFGPKVASFVSGPIKTVETSSSGESELFGFPSDSKSSKFLEFPAGIAEESAGSS